MSQEVRNIIAKNVEKLRTTKKISREELSLAIGVDNSYISKLEKGRINITLDKMAKIAKYFEIEPYLLLKDAS